MTKYTDTSKNPIAMERVASEQTVHPKEVVNLPARSAESVPLMLAPQRPGGITFLALFNIIGGIALALFATQITHAEEAPIQLLSSVLSVVIGLGLYWLNPWARYAAIVGYVLNVIAGVVLQAPVTVLIGTLCAGYLCGEKIKVAFRKDPR